MSSCWGSCRRRSTDDFLTFFSFGVEDHLEESNQRKRARGGSVSQTFPSRTRANKLRRGKGEKGQQIERTSSSFVRCSEGAKELARVLPWTDGVGSGFTGAGEVEADIRRRVRSWEVEVRGKKGRKARLFILRSFGRATPSPKAPGQHPKNCPSFNSQT